MVLTLALMGGVVLFFGSIISVLVAAAGFVVELLHLGVQAIMAVLGFGTHVVYREVPQKVRTTEQPQPHAQNQVQTQAPQVATAAPVYFAPAPAAVVDDEGDPFVEERGDGIMSRVQQVLDQVREELPLVAAVSDVLSFDPGSTTSLVGVLRETKPSAKGGVVGKLADPTGVVPVWLPEAVGNSIPSEGTVVVLEGRVCRSSNHQRWLKAASWGTPD